MVVDFNEDSQLALQPRIAVTDRQVQRARAIIVSMLPGQAGNMDAVLLAGVAHALAMQESVQSAFRH